MKKLVLCFSILFAAPLAALQGNQIIVILGNRQHEHFLIGVSFTNRRQGLDPIQNRHINIQQDDIRLDTFDDRECFLSIGGLSNNDKIRHFFQQAN